ncbi:nickel/cobalt transporter [Prosthecomicrobium pneumaticum]|uniref:Nickel/cobalt efflux system n=1 Tax=Prosthecomicrobium pneumaticum TaxID=81895 RepID=A0A7W9FKC8_9HYPH|nr:nickel/cobalt transporter [Prosthecomicrobium pneumaticum]MBB5752516.1 ABC-type nickel/cobalt efflux system permease component RcnA [Prosthecomicrobium pneumaticum]
MIRTPRLALAALCLAALPAAAAPSPFGVGTPDGGGAASWAGPLAPLFGWIAVEQAAFYRELTRALSALGESGHAAALLVALSFAYGVFHAAGPGHGKAVVASWLFVSGERLRRGVAIAFLAAIAQAVTAIAVVGFGTVLLGVTAFTMTRATDALEATSYALIALCGAVLLVTKLTGFGRRAGPVAAAAPATAPAIAPMPLRPAGTRAFACDDASAGHVHGPDCGHAHAPDPALLDRPLTIGRAWAAVLAVGVRPCTGAIIVLVFALSQRLWWAGLLSVLVMALGTAITVSALAALAVKARDLALRFSSGGGAGVAALRGLEIAAAAAILLFGLAMLGGALSA